MTIEAAISAIAEISTNSGLIFTPWVSSLKKVRRPALEAGMGAFFFLLLMNYDDCATVLKSNAGASPPRGEVS